MIFSTNNKISLSTKSLSAYFWKLSLIIKIELQKGWIEAL